MKHTVDGAREAFSTGRTLPLTWRRQQLEGLERMLSECGEEIREALSQDLGKSSAESQLTEVLSVRSEIRHTARSLRKWTRPRRVRTPLTLGMASAAVQREPLGTVLIISPWNYPVHLLLMPLVGALAAGNTVVLKPSEMAPAVSALMARRIPEYLEPEAVVVVEGGADETTRLLEQPFDHIFFTGGSGVASIVMSAAAKHLTPVTLELGGKSPAWVDGSADLKEAAESIVWGKFTNSGQTCVAPDHVLTTPELAEPLGKEISRAIIRAYGTDPQQSGDYGRIVNERHARRLAALLEQDSGRALIGGDVDIADRFVSPTVLVDVPEDAAVMEEEIFGPILPIVTVADHRAAIEVVNSRPKPLALYAFTRDAQVRADFVERTSSGGLAFNTVMTQLAVPALPFGGVGASGMGRYHGEYSLQTFSHERAVLRKLPGPDPTRLVRAPVGRRVRRLLVKR